jgi:hypothetical protein
MDQAKHTPGPWYLVKPSWRTMHTLRVVIPIKDGHQIFWKDKEDGGFPEESVANARLITASPDTLEALEELFNLLEEHQGEATWYLKGHYNRANAAINKAKEGTK